jgi:hypothetical protein
MSEVKKTLLPFILSQKRQNLIQKGKLKGERLTKAG